SVRIVSVSGAGMLAETVIIKNFGAGEVNLAGWQLQDEDGNIFIFPPMTLIANGAVQVHTATGTNSVVDLYWNLQDPVWESGEEAQLTDAQDNVREAYQVP
ncbi:MAG: lamin tail domain-containing protein, partial [Chloroflexota bacterium]